LKKLRTTVIITAMVLSLFAFSSTSVTAAPEKAAADINIAIVFATGGLGDKSFNDAAYRGLVEANTTYAGQFNYSYSEPDLFSDFPAHQDAFADGGEYDLIICVGFLQFDALNASTITYPNQRFVIIDSVLDKPNVSSITFKEQEGSYLVGAMAAMTTESDKIGFLGGMEIFLIDKFLAGYQQGAKYINPDIEITSVYSPDPTNPWGDIAGGKSIAETMINNGNDVIYAAAGGTGIGVIQAANETEDVYAIGVDSDQDYMAEGSVLCSMLKKVETATFESIKAIIDGSWDTDWAGEHTELGLEEGGVGISEMTFTETIKNGNFELNGTTKTRWEWITDISNKIVAGTIVVGDTPEKTPAATPGFESWAILPVLGFVAIIVLRKRRE